MKRTIIAVLVLVLLSGWAVAAGLGVGEAVICKDVKDRTPVEPGDSFPTDVGKLYCFTRITGAADATTVSHVWFLNDKQVSAVDLKVGSSNWRTWSSKQIKPSDEGSWKVEIRDLSGKVLTAVEFKTYRPEPEGSETKP
ncbi:MAG TPA: DUF2914 domain-containing protein [bacterium]|nr:DUF2914 domain-containing protein [bacterium]